MSLDKVPVPSLAPITSSSSPSTLSSFPSFPSPKVSTIPKPAPKPAARTISTMPIVKGNITIIEDVKDKNLYDVVTLNIENELMKSGYAAINKIVIHSENGSKTLRYVKAINKKGQKVYILIDTHTHMAINPKDLIIKENNISNSLPFSLKNGMYNCADKDVTGVALEYGSNSICTLMMDPIDLKIKEKNYIINDKQTINEKCDHVVSYPIIRLTEIKVNPKIIIDNTHIVINRLRNAEEIYAKNEIVAQNESINKLANAFTDFGNLCEDVADKLYDDLNKLEGWNETYLRDPPNEDEYKERFAKLQLNLAKRNDDINNLMRIMKIVASKRSQIESIANDINEIIEYCQREFPDPI